MAQGAHQIKKIRSVFPFDLTPNTVTVDKNKVDLTYYRIPSYKKILTLFFEDIRTVKVVEGIFFATLRFEVKGLDQNPEPIHYLKKSDANEIRNLILGICTTKKTQTSLQKNPSNYGSVKNALRKIGKVKYAHD